MWYPATIATPAASEPITLAQARVQCRIDTEDTDYDADLNMLIAAARAHVEKYTGLRLVTQTLTLKCDCFEDFARLTEGPINSITSITYVDTDGTTQTLSTDVYELRADSLNAAIALKYAQVWPVIQLGSRITVTASVGYSTVPADVTHALLLYIGDSFEKKENAMREDWTMLDALLSNHRLGPY